MDIRRRNLSILSFLAFSGAVGISLFRPTLPIFSRSMGATGFEVGALTSGFMLARALCAYLFGRFSDRIQRRKLFLPLGFLLYLFSCAGLFFARSYAEVLTICIFQGMISGMMWPMAQVVAIESTVRSFKTRALSLYFASGNAGMSLGNALLGAAIIFIMFRFNTDETSAFRYIFLLSGIIFVIGFFCSLFLSETSGMTEGGGQGKQGHRGKMSAEFYALLFIAFFIGVVPGLIRSIMVIYLNEQFLMPTQHIAFVLMASNIAALLSMLLFSYLSDKKGILWMLVAVSVLTAVSAIIIPIANSKAFLIILMIMSAAGARSFTPISRSSVSELSGKKLGQNIGLINTVSNLASVAGPLAGGFFYDLFPFPFKAVNLNVSIFSIVGCFILLSMAVLLFIVKRMSMSEQSG